ncbi:hypothetical protein F9L16_23620 [Agarivorans sp. B2Z047]|uniref:phage minor head protein n=1 Tax=Agarivorans sp. B2Z047 TaxID=2652721 RepID=UPI00128C5219|nr:phage minor head protein [Agarivorans sp. B2Z047]MPW31947.1 hypothetical protein [Agarivorans sp. B2Z047]UQN41888.1 hypothetical protein LQZ07_19230 [Agarivorans sp. B2Z047]UQN44879.1 hypothetical protein LQZ07_10565 [Agarivorans sp. B2Z047]
MIILPLDPSKARKKVRVGKPVKPSRSAEVAYRKGMLEQLKLQRGTATQLVQQMQQGASKAAVSAYLAKAVNASKHQFDELAKRLAPQFVDGFSDEHRRRTERMIASAFGVDWASITDEPEVRGELDLRIIRNVELIESVGAKYWSDISQVVESSFAGTLEKPLIESIAEMGAKSRTQAKLIARDQTSKLASSLNEVRQRSNGIDEYDWSNSKDIRVVGNPAGQYPKGNDKHGNHWKREGKRFSWSKPPHDGHPGQPILCRCTARPVIDLEKIKAQFV